VGIEQIPPLDLSTEIESLWEDINGAIQEVLRSGQFIMGPAVGAFEQEVADYLGVKHAMGVNSGTDALVIALRSLGVGPGDEVITTPFTFFATAEAVSQVGATPVFVDIDSRTFNIDSDLIEEKVTTRTKAILPVHLYGQTADMDSVFEVARKHGLLVVEDVAQAFGSEYKGEKAGTLGDAGAFSFFPSKSLGAYGDGGLIATNDDSVAEQARMLRVHGARKKYYNEVLGYNSRLDSLQAAILRVKLPHADAWAEARAGAARVYDELLEGVTDLVLPYKSNDTKHIYHQYTIRIRQGRRDEIKARLAEAGIGTMIYYPVPVHQLPIYADLSYQLPIAEAAATEVLSLPIWPQIQRDVQERVATTLCQALG
jgi:dTDP-4-amino-4,6-dideoxygalactose transaminase